MKFRCETAGRLPIYRQLIEQIREGVATGKLEPGERLPSVRQLSRELVVNPNTIARAYTELEREGVIHARQGLGVFVAEVQSELTARSRKRRLAEALDRFLTEAVHLNFTAEEVLAAVEDRIGGFQFASSG